MLSQLYGRTHDSISLEEALEKYHKVFENAVGLFYSPETCCFGKIQGANVTWGSKTISLDQVFEARIFNEKAELRWLNEFSGKGKAALLSEEQLSRGLTKALESFDDLKIISKNPQTYLLWGKQVDSRTTKAPIPSGWSCLAAARIGLLDVPIEQITAKDGRVRLKTVEYLAEVDDHGNVAVVEERLVKLDAEEHISSKNQ